jgi:hypothetical protein
MALGFAHGRDSKGTSAGSIVVLAPCYTMPHDKKT